MFYAASLESYLATGDWDIGFDLFCIPGMPEREFGPLEADILVDIFEASMIRAVPELAFDGLAAKRALRAWARCALDIAAEKTPAFTRLEQCAEALSDYRSSVVPYIRETPREMERLLAALLLPLVPFSRRTALRQRIAAIVGNVVGLMSADGYAARAFGPA